MNNVFAATNLASGFDQHQEGLLVLVAVKAKEPKLPRKRLGCTEMKWTAGTKHHYPEFGNPRGSPSFQQFAFDDPTPADVLKKRNPLAGSLESAGGYFAPWPPITAGSVAIRM